MDNISLFLSSTSRAALVGDNGEGKSTLLKAACSLIETESLEISQTKGSRIAYLSQQDEIKEDVSVFDVIKRGFDYQKKEEEKLSEGEKRSRIESTAIALGFKKEDLSRSCLSFSGGEKMRAALCKVLVENPDFLLLDEPTNFLDLDGLLFLESFIKRFKGGLLVVSHDREFLDKCTNETYEIKGGKLSRYSGNYSFYLEEKSKKEREEEKERKKRERERKSDEEFVERFRYKATKARQVQSRIKQMEKREETNEKRGEKTVSISFKDVPHSGNDVLYAKNISKSFDGRTIINSLSLYVRKKDKVAITGKNGIGKSTLIKILYGLDNECGGSVKYGSGVKKALYMEDMSFLDPSSTVLEEAEKEAETHDLPSLRSLLGAFLFLGDDVYKKVSVLSGGERARLTLIKVLLKKANLLFLDEPTNHLDIRTKEIFLNAVKNYSGTVIFSSHDRYFIKNTANKILYLTEGKAELFEGDYEYFQYILDKKEEEFFPSEKERTVKKKADKSEKNKIRSYEREAEEIIKLLASLTDEKKEIERKMNEEEVYRDREKIMVYEERKKLIEKEIGEKEEKWLYLSEEIGKWKE